MNATLNMTGVFAVLAAEGRYGDECPIYATFTDLAKARLYAKSGGCQILSGCRQAAGTRVGRGELATMKSAGLWREV